MAIGETIFVNLTFCEGIFSRPLPFVRDIFQIWIISNVNSNLKKTKQEGTLGKRGGADLLEDNFEGSDLCMFSIERFVLLTSIKLLI